MVGSAGSLESPLLGPCEGLDSELGHVVEYDGVKLGGVEEMPAKAISALLGSVGGLLVLGPSLPFGLPDLTGLSRLGRGMFEPSVETGPRGLWRWPWSCLSQPRSR